MKRAFTLIELLVVIAIIAILAAILFPVFAQAKEAAKKSQCLSNTNQLALSVQLYATDYDDAIVAWLECSGSATYCVGAPKVRSDRVFSGRLYPYTKSGYGFPASGVYVCPSFSFSNITKSANQNDCDGPGALSPYLPPLVTGGKQEVYSEYGLAFEMCPDEQYDANNFPCTHPADYGKDGKTVETALILYPGSREYPTSKGGLTRYLTEIARPAETTISGDGGLWVGGGFFLTIFGCESTFSHGGGGGNFAFLDAHAKNIRGNPERYRIQLASNGLWVEKYFYYAE